MKIKHVESSYVFEAQDDAAKELIERGDYEKATKADQAVAEPAPVIPRRKGRKA